MVKGIHLLFVLLYDLLVIEPKLLVSLAGINDIKSLFISINLTFSNKDFDLIEINHSSGYIADDWVPLSAFERIFRPCNRQFRDQRPQNYKIHSTLAYHVDRPED